MWTLGAGLGVCGGLTDCHERVGELVLLFGRGQLVFERELLQRFAPLQRLRLPLTLHDLLQTQADRHVCGRSRWLNSPVLLLIMKHSHLLRLHGNSKKELPAASKPTGVKQEVTS